MGEGYIWRQDKDSNQTTGSIVCFVIISHYLITCIISVILFPGGLFVISYSPHHQHHVFHNIVYYVNGGAITFAVPLKSLGRARPVPLFFLYTDRIWIEYGTR